MATASVLIPLSAINQNGGVLPPSAVVQHAARHGRSRGASMKGKSAGGRGYNVVENSDVTIAKAVTFVLKRSVSEGEIETDEEESAYLVSDAEGWVPVKSLLDQTRLSDLRVTLEDLLRVASSTGKARFTLRQLPDTASEDAGSYQIRQNYKRDSLQAPVLDEKPLTVDSENLPEYIVYETSYQAYPLVLASGGIHRAAGATYSSFSPVNVDTDGNDINHNRTNADISIWIHLRSAMEAEPSITWQRTVIGSIVTVDDVPKSLWKKAVARRPDIGLLFEDGEVRKEVPEILRGKGAKGKAKKGKGSLKTRGDEESGSASEE